MRRKRDPELERIQESVFYIPDATVAEDTRLRMREKYIDEYYPRLMIEDMKLGIMPIGGRADKKQFQVSVEPKNPEVKQTIEKALTLGEYHRDLASVVCDFVAGCAVELLIYEKATYEIAHLLETKSKELAGFELIHINPRTLIHREKELLQFVPTELADKLGKPQYIKLTPERIITFEIPPSYRAKVGKIMESLGVLGVHTMPEFVMRDITSGSRSTAYDTKHHIHMHNLALASVTKFLGWNARLLFQNEAMEYYLIHRSLMFERFKIELRDSIIKTLNEGIKRAGEQVGFIAEIVVTGLPTLNDVQTAYNHLREGDVPFGEVLEPFQGFQYCSLC